ncbi:ABC transporter ATP-binding protein [Arthrobacter agilis]|uniref:ABC transporter ATP-binding protein n=1 Tax=Arthrobacter agilis TaxID=37921 RepID=UPI00278AFDC5|nr:ABC transporter ATP-binding protein [Arthrobacter agilis]MDQ0736365.1 putative ABC transport system ATP-binding protein [Arthrobacter agilis]
MMTPPPGPLLPSAHPTPPVLSARGLTKTYDTTRALAELSLDIHAGESVAIMGPSGGGKTTLLHCLAGIITPDAGQVVLQHGHGATDVARLSDSARSALRRSTFGFVFQQGLLIPELTALENVAVALMLLGVDRAAAEHSAAQWLAALGLGGLEDRRLGQLSGGQAQRVAIARAQVSGAAVVFADEPTGALDSSTSAEVLDLLLESTTGTGRTLVVVTHDDDVARRCARTVRLRDGRIVSDSRHAGAAA